MNILKLKKEYENRIAKIRAWNKLKEPKYQKTIRYVSIFLGFILSAAIIFLSIRLKNDINKQITWIVSIILLEFLYLFIIYLYLRRKPDSAMNNKDIISTFEMERVKSLRRLLIKENICFDDVEKIQIIINEVKYCKTQVVPFCDIGKFILNPLVIIFIPCFTVFLDHLTQAEDLGMQARFFLILLILIALGLIISFLFVDPIRWLLYRKYDNFIIDLKLLQIIKYK